jgi:hypothetical protein
MQVELEDELGAGQLSCLPRCPHCGINRPQIVKVFIPERAQPRLDGGELTHWGVYGCTGCGGLVVVKGLPGFSPPYSRICEVFPGLLSAHEDLPQVARRYLNQAYETLGSPDASAVMSGSAVDAMLKELGYTDGSVYSRIDQAVTDHKITESMGQWAHSVRLGSNRPRHADLESPHVTPEEARQSVDFAEALGNFLFVLSARIQRGIEASQNTDSNAQ